MRHLPLASAVLASLICVSAGLYAATPANGAGDTPPPAPCGDHGGSGPHHRGPHGRHGHWPTPEERAQRMQEELGLSDAQASKVTEAGKRFGESMRALHEKVREEHRAEFEAIMDAHDKEMKAILDDKQYQEWRAHREKMRAMHKDGDHPRH